MDAVAELRGQIESAALDHTLDASERFAKLSALRNELAPLLGEIDRRAADAQKIREAEAASQSREVLWARSNASMREAVIERGDLTAEEADAMGMLSHAELDRLQEEGLLEEAVGGIARQWEEALHPRGHGGEWAKKFGSAPSAPGMHSEPKLEPKRETVAVHRLRVGDRFDAAARTKGTLTVKHRSGAGIVAGDEAGRTFEFAHHEFVPRHVQPEQDAHAEADDKALRALADYHAVRAEHAEGEITPALQEAVKAEGGDLHGLEFRLKSRASIVSKIKRQRETKPGMTDEERAAAVTDLVRYTATFPSDGYNQGVERTMGALEQKGFKQTEFKNYWGGADDYDGLHVIMQGPGGASVELQFHTPESLETKGNLHPLFEQFRESKDAHERWSIWEQMIEHTSKIPQPKGVEELGPALPSSSQRQRVARGEHVPPAGALKENHGDYFKGLDHPDTKTVPIDQLTPTKPPEGQPDSVDKAQQLMADAAAGRGGKRDPITVRPKKGGGGYEIVDGNATYGAATRHGWETLPVRVEGEASTGNKSPGQGGITDEEHRARVQASLTPEQKALVPALVEKGATPEQAEALALKGRKTFTVDDDGTVRFKATGRNYRIETNGRIHFS